MSGLKNEMKNIQSTNVVVIVAMLLCGYMGVTSASGQPKTTTCELNLFKNVDTIVVAHVRHVGVGPGYESGYVLATQRAVFGVDRVLRGKVTNKIILVMFAAHSGSSALDELQRNSRVLLLLGTRSGYSRFRRLGRRYETFDYQPDNCFWLPSRRNLRTLGFKTNQ